MKNITKITSFFKKKSAEEIENQSIINDDILEMTNELEKSNLNDSAESLTNTNILNEQRYYSEKPNQPIIDFSQNSKRRKFQEKWYKEFAWLEYEVANDVAKCFICKQYPYKEKDKGAFKSTGFNDWHNAKNAFNLHDKSESHKTNQMLLLNRIDVEKNN
jgi:hypothetical protein